MTDKLQIQIPEGYEIDTFDLKTGLITFKKKPVERWRDNPKSIVEGYYISNQSKIQFICGGKREEDNNVFASEVQAQSALAKAQLSQIIANDHRFGGPITDKEWLNCDAKHVICRMNGKVSPGTMYTTYTYLAFHTEAQRDLFLKENEDLIKQYFML